MSPRPGFPVVDGVTGEPRAVVHLNVAHFAVSVERVVDTRLRQRPVIVAPEGAARALVYDMSEEAYLAGVRKGLALSRARRLCRDARLLPPRPDRYERAMRALEERVRPYAPVTEVADESGHLFLDLTGTRRLLGPPPDVAWRIRKEVRSALGLDPIWSVAPNKLVAKVASRLVKPLGEYIVAPGEEAAFLRPLPLTYLPGLEREHLLLLRDLRLRRMGEVARLTVSQLQVVVGSAACQLHDGVRGIDLSPVVPANQGRSPVRQEHTFDEDTTDAPAVEGALYAMVERAGRRLRRRGLAARRVGLVLDYADGGRLIRSASTARATASDPRLFSLAHAALRRAWTRRVRLRHLRLECDRLVYPPAQLELWPDQEQQDQQEGDLVAALDCIRRRFGDQAIQVGRTLTPQGSDSGQGSDPGAASAA